MKISLIMNPGDGFLSIRAFMVAGGPNRAPEFGIKPVF
jgi:hypothetical protein